MTFEDYLKKEMQGGKIDFSIRSHVDDKGVITFYIHPDGRDGLTFDFIVRGNSLTSRLFE